MSVVHLLLVHFVCHVLVVGLVDVALFPGGNSVEMSLQRADGHEREREGTSSWKKFSKRKTSDQKSAWRRGKPQAQNRTNRSRSGGARRQLLGAASFLRGSGRRHHTPPYPAGSASLPRPPPGVRATPSAHRPAPALARLAPGTPPRPGRRWDRPLTSLQTPLFHTPSASPAQLSRPRPLPIPPLSTIPVASLRFNLNPRTCGMPPFRGFLAAFPGHLPAPSTLLLPFASPPSPPSPAPHAPTSGRSGVSPLTSLVSLTWTRTRTHPWRNGPYVGGNEGSTPRLEGGGRGGGSCGEGGASLFKHPCLAPRCRRSP